jgi:hypothetical protein
LILEGFSPRTFPAKLTVLDRKTRTIAGRSTGYPQWLLSTERVQQVVSIEGHEYLCEYRTWQTVQGIASYFLILFAKEELAESLRTNATNLKTFVEKEKS